LAAPALVATTAEANNPRVTPVRNLRLEKSSRSLLVLCMLILSHGDRFVPLCFDTNRSSVLDAEPS
jgi:hypothetical protein